MNYEMQNITLSRIFARTLADAMLSRPAGALIPTSAIMLWKNDFTPTPDSLDADFIPCDFSGYADWAGPLAGPYNFGDEAVAVTGFAIWGATTATPFVPGTAFGYVILDSVSGHWAAAERFDNPVPFAAVGDALALITNIPVSMFQTGIANV